MNYQLSEGRRELNENFFSLIFGIKAFCAAQLKCICSRENVIELGKTNIYSTTEISSGLEMDGEQL